ncbi:uncharacterized protein VTP21DRAFT_4758 [Calcarisporiella thermophila]|uniref:uncharacterized protein n=1 Tax=Calcarisporiella thermophila TaxID=911321 RepID=UPI0037423F96
MDLPEGQGFMEEVLVTLKFHLEISHEEEKRRGGCKFPMSSQKRHELSDALRNEIVELFKSGAKRKEISQKTGVPMSTVGNTIRRWTSTGLITPMKRPGRPRVLRDRDLCKLDCLVKQNAGATLRMITDEFNLVSDIKVSERTIQRSLRELKSKSS